MQKNKIIKYIHSIVHSALFKEVCDDPIYTALTKQNLYNIIRKYSNLNLERIYRIDLVSIFNYELNYYISKTDKDNSFVCTLFKDFIDFYKKCTVLNDILNCLYYGHNTDNINIFYPNNIFLYQWKLFVIEPNIHRIKNYISVIVNNKKSNDNEIETVNTIMYSLQSKYRDMSNDIINFVKTNRSQYLDRISFTATDLTLFIDIYKNEIEIHKNINDIYEERFNFVPEDVITAFFTNNNKLKELLELCLLNKDTQTLTYADIYLYNYFDRDIYILFLEKIIHTISEDYNNRNNINNRNIDEIEKYIIVRKKISEIFRKDTFEVCQQIIDTQFNYLKNSEQIEKQINEKLYSSSFNQHEPYYNLIQYCNEEIFVSLYSMLLCKKIINKSINIQDDRPYIMSLQPKLKDYFYRLKIILDDYVESCLFSKQLNYSYIVIGRHSIWPLKINEPTIPNSFVNEYNNINKLYSENKNYTNRKLYLCNSLLRCDIEFNGYTFNIKGKYVDFLLMFNKQDKLPKNTVTEDISKFIKINLIKEDSTHYFVNDTFHCSKKKIKLN